MSTPTNAHATRTLTRLDTRGGYDMEGQGSLGRVELIGEGQTIPVSVESVFRDGFVVSFITGDGLFEYRGALLCQSSWCNR